MTATTIEIELEQPTWESHLGLLLTLYTEGNAEGRAFARKELTRMAKAADHAAALERKEAGR